MPGIMQLKQREPHILVVEDDVNNRKLFVAFIQKKITPKVGGVSSVWEAIEYINHHGNIALVVTDVSLAPVGNCHFQEMDGIDLTGIVTRKWDIPVIVMTGYVTEERMTMALQAGASCFLPKPVPLDTLENAIDRILPDRHSGADCSANPLPAEELS